jgi:hypothetical protein
MFLSIFLGGPPKISIEPRIINLKEGQRMIVQYTVSVSVLHSKRKNQFDFVSN